MYYCLRYMTHNPNTYSVCYSIIRSGQVFGFVYECVYHTKKHVYMFRLIDYTHVNNIIYLAVVYIRSSL